MEENINKVEIWSHFFFPDSETSGTSIGLLWEAWYVGLSDPILRKSMDNIYVPNSLLKARNLPDIQCWFSSFCNFIFDESSPISIFEQLAADISFSLYSRVKRDHIKMF